MGNGVSTDQGNIPAHGKRDVRETADTEQHDWSELAEAPNTNSLLSGRNAYIIAIKLWSLLYVCSCLISNVQARWIAERGHGGVTHRTDGGRRTGARLWGSWRQPSESVFSVRAAPSRTVIVTVAAPCGRLWSRFPPRNSLRMLHTSVQLQRADGVLSIDWLTSALVTANSSETTKQRQNWTNDKLDTCETR